MGKKVGPILPTPVIREKLLRLSESLKEMVGNVVNAPGGYAESIFASLVDSNFFTYKFY